jgi:hypothetical protein
MLSQKSLIPSPPIPYPPTSISWPWCSPILRQIKFARPMGLSFHWWATRPSSDTCAARDRSSGVLVSSYCCSTYRVAVPFSSLGAFSSSSTGGPVIHPIADCEHPLLCLLSLRHSLTRDWVLSAKSCWCMQWCQRLEADYGMDPRVWQSNKHIFSARLLR